MSAPLAPLPPGWISQWLVMNLSLIYVLLLQRTFLLLQLLLTSLPSTLLPFYLTSGIQLQVVMFS